MFELRHEVATPRSIETTDETSMSWISIVSPYCIFQLRKLLHKLNKRFIDGLHEQLKVTRTVKSRAVLIKSTELQGAAIAQWNGPCLILQ